MNCSKETVMKAAKKCGITLEQAKKFADEIAKQDKKTPLQQLNLKGIFC